MSTEYSYDEDGYLWPFFVFTLALIVTVPLTFVLIKRSRDPAAAFPRIRTDFRHAHWNVVEALRRREKRKDRKLWLTFMVLGGWLVIAYMIYLIQTTEAPTKTLWNPYDILNIPESASEKLIKTTFRKLSRKFHPDKVRPDLAKNETVDGLNVRYVEISKAYQALTDEVVRNNYIQFGNPDGKQGYSINIALPKAIVSDGNGKYIVLLYSLLFGVLLPYTVGSWWYGNLRRSKEGVLMESSNRLFRKFDDQLDEGAALAALSSGKEFEHLFAGDKADSGLAKVESRTAEASWVMSAQERERLENVESGPQKKALALLWAYLGRVELDDPALEKAKFEVAPIAHALNKSFTAILLAYSTTKPLLASYRAGQLLMQAIPPKASPLLQLPYFTREVVAAIDGDSRVHKTLQAFMDQPDARRRQLAVGPGLLTEEQYREAVRVAKQIPYLRVAKAFFKVVGERIVTPGAQVTLVIKGRFIPPGSENIPDMVEADLEDVDPAEDDLDAILGRKKKTKTKTKTKTTVGKVGGAEGKKEEKEREAEGDGETLMVPPLTAAPYFARDHSPRWHVFLADSKQGRVAVPPFTFAQFDRRPFVLADGDNRPTYAMQTLRAQFVAPPGPGDYTFVMHVVCDSYVGLDTKMEVVLQVKDQSEAKQVPVVEDEISEPEEDLLSDPACLERRLDRRPHERRKGRGHQARGGQEERGRGRVERRGERDGGGGERHGRNQHGHGARELAAGAGRSLSLNGPSSYYAWNRTYASSSFLCISSLYPLRG